MLMLTAWRNGLTPQSSVIPESQAARGRGLADAVRMSGGATGPTQASPRSVPYYIPSSQLEDAQLQRVFDRLLGVTVKSAHIFLPL